MGRKGDRTRTRILEVAAAAFAEKGFDGARVDAIARTAAINKERVYAYFGDKRRLYAAALDTTYRGLVDAEAPLMALSAADAPRLSREILSLYFAFHRRNPQFARILAWENLGGGVFAENFGPLRRRCLQHLAAVYAAGQRAGVFRRDVSFETYFYVLSATAFFYFSNMKTMSRTLGVDLQSRTTEARVIDEICQLMERSGGRRGGVCGSGRASEVTSMSSSGERS